jgi:hypothetical protein
MQDVSDARAMRGQSPGDQTMAIKRIALRTH